MTGHELRDLYREYEVDPATAWGTICAQFYARGMAAALTSATPAGEGLMAVVEAHIADLRRCLPTLHAYRLIATALEFAQAADELEAALAASPVPMADEPECERLSGHDWVKAAGGPTQCAKCGLTKADERGSAGPELHPIFAFLDGSAAFEGVWYGDTHPTRKGAFWWRSVLREALATTHSAPVAGMTDAKYAARWREILRTGIPYSKDRDYTDDEIAELVDKRIAARAIEAALREKAGGGA